MQHRKLVLRPVAILVLAAFLSPSFFATTHAQPGPGFSLRFDDTGNYAGVPHTAELNAFPLTVTAWVKTSQTTGQQGLVNKYVANSLNGWNVFLLNGGVRAWYFANNSRFVWDGSNGLDGGFIADGAWHHIAFTVDAAGGRLYVDGVLRASRAWSGAAGAATTAQEMRFGSYPGGSVPFNGLLDEISVWRAALSPSQITTTSFSPPTGTEADLIAFYQCDEGTGATVADSAPLAGDNLGTWVGTPLYLPSVIAFAAQNDGGTPPSDCSGVPANTEVKLDWSGQNLVGCKVELNALRSRIHRVASDCSTIFYTDLPSYVPRSWHILSQPIGADIDVIVDGNNAMLPLPVAGDYTVQLTICPGGSCSVFEFPGSPSTFPLGTSSGTITIRALAELPLRVEERPVLPPSALTPTPRLDLTDEERACRCLGGGGLVDPQWVTVEPWNGANDYRLLEGYVVRSWPSITDAPFNHDLAFDGGNWYVIHDINVIVSPDPRHFNLVSSKPEFESNPHLVGCEAQGDRIPERFRPVEGDRVSLFGFWILDCGHPPFYTEIHPIIGWGVHRNRPVRIPDNATFTFDLVTNTVSATAGQNLFVPGIVTDLWFNSSAGAITGGDNTSLAQPASRGPPPFEEFCLGGNNITSSPIAREYDFNIYLPKNPSQVFAEAGQVRPRAPLHISITNPHAGDGPDPTVTRVTETVNGVTYEYLRVHLDLRGYPFPTYSRRIEAAWVYPMADNWGLAQWRVALHQLDVYNDLDSKARYPGSDGDWILWMMLPSADQSWTRILDGFNNTHGTMTFNPPWQTGSSDSVFRRSPLSVDAQRRLGPDILSFSPYINFWMGGYEADEGYDDDPGRISGFVFNPGTAERWTSHNGVFTAELGLQRLATLNNGALSPAAAELSRHYLLTCTNRIPRNPFRDVINPLEGPGLLAEGISGEPPLTPVDPQLIYGSGAALLGDVNDDGFPDMVLGTRGTNAEAHLFLGGRNGFSPAPHAIASVLLPDSAGHSRVQTRTRIFTGASDLNGDGVADLLFGAPTFQGGAHSNGAVFAFSGTQLRGGGTISHSNALWSLSIGHSNAQFGFSLAAGDINRDGISDIVVGAPFHSNSMTTGLPAGRVFVYFGSPAIHSNMPPDQTVIPPVLDMNSRHWFGYAVSMAGDVNGDGHTDVLIGAPRYTRTLMDRGACYLYYGSPTGLVLNTSLLLEGDLANGQFGYAVAGVGDADQDGYHDVLVGAPFASGSELTLQNGYVHLYRGQPEGLIGFPWWTKFGGTGGAHFGTDLGPVGDLNGDGHADIAIAAPGEIGADGMRGAVSYFLGMPDNALQGAETWRTWGVNRVASLMINSPCCVPFISPCCNTGSTNKFDINLDGFADALTFDSSGDGDPFTRVQLTLGRGLKAQVPTEDRFFRAGATEPFTFPEIFHSNAVANIIVSGQTNETKLTALYSQVKSLYLTVQEAGGDPGGIVPMLQQLQTVHSNLSALGFAHSNLFQQVFADVELDLGTAFYIDCGATLEYADALGRRWLPDGPFLATANANLATFAIGPITNTLPDHYLPDAMLNSERWFDGHIRYQVGVPNGWYTVLLYFSENYEPAASPALGGIGCSTCARIFDLEVEGQRVSAYNQADAALPPDGDGLGRLFTATQVPFHMEVTDGLIDIAVLDRGRGNPPENAAIKGIAILGRPNPEVKFATRPRIVHTTFDGGRFGVVVDPRAGLARYFAGEIPLRLQSSSDLQQWATLPDAPEAGANGAFFSLPLSPNAPSFYRAVIPTP